MRVILDGVFNHTGRGFWPFHHVLETGPASPYRDWFHLDEAALDAGKPLLAYPPAGHARRVALGYEAWWGLPALPKLNTDEPAVREYLFGVAEHWLRFGIDGWRLDVPAEIDDEAFWQEFRRAAGRSARMRTSSARSGTSPPSGCCGDRFDALMNYPLAEAILGFAGGPRAQRWTSLPSPPRVRRQRGAAGRRRASAPGSRDLQLAYDPATIAVQLNLLGTHDAPRVRTVLGGDAARVRLAVLLQATLPGAPCVYYGDEVGLVGGNDPDCRGAFPWDEARWEPGLRESVRALFRLRSAEPALRDGPLSVVGAVGSAVGIERGSGAARFVVVANAGEAAERLPLRFADAPAGHGGHLAPVALPGFAGVGEASIVDGTATIEVAARSGGVVRVV